MTTVFAEAPVVRLVEKYRAAERKAAEARGGFFLFGLFAWENAPGRFDIVVAAPWLTADSNGIYAVAQYLPHLEPGEGARIGRIDVLDSDSLFVRMLNERYPTEHEVLEFPGIFWEGERIARGFIITSNSHPAPATAQAA